MSDKNLRQAVEAAQNLGRQFWEVRAAKDKPKEGELLIYGPIWGNKVFDGEVAPSAIRDALKKLGDIETLKVFVNSRGGDVFAGNAIYNILRRHSAQVLVYVDGLAASAASVIAMAGDKIIMPKNAMMMVHRAWSITIGNAIDMEEFAGTLRQIDDTLIEVYMEKTKLSREKIVELIDAETWMTGTKAVELGFADEIEESKAVAASIDGDFLVMNGERVDLTLFQCRPPLPETPVSAPSATDPSPGPVLQPVDKPAPTEERLNELHAQGVITRAEWVNGLRALTGLPPLGNPPEPHTPSIPERQTPLSFYARRLRVRQNERMVAP